MGTLKLPRWKRYDMVHPERRRDAQQRYRIKNRERRNAQKREWYKRNKKHVQEYQKAWIAKQPDKFWNRWPSRPPQRKRKPGRTYSEKLQANRTAQAKVRAELGDSYLRGWMSRETGYTIKPNMWPESLVQCKRAQIKLKRLWRGQKTSTS